MSAICKISAIKILQWVKCSLWDKRSTPRVRCEGSRKKDGDNCRRRHVVVINRLSRLVETRTPCVVFIISLALFSNCRCRIDLICTRWSLIMSMSWWAETNAFYVYLYLIYCHMWLYFRLCRWVWSRSWVGWTLDTWELSDLSNKVELSIRRWNAHQKL